MSAACHAARSDGLRNLPAAQLLMRLDDRDIALCRTNRDRSMGKLTFIALAIPVALAFSHETVQECILDVVIFHCQWILVRSISLPVCVPYTLLVAYLIYRYGYFLPTRKLQAEEAKRKVQYEEHVSNMSTSKKKSKRKKVKVLKPISESKSHLLKTLLG